MTNNAILRQPPHRRHTGGRLFSPLHKKGVLTLTLFILAESINTTNAVNFWNTNKQQGNTKQQQHSKPFSSWRNMKKGTPEQQCSTATVSNIHYNPNISPKLGKIFQIQSLLHARKDVGLSSENAKCCESCYYCMDPQIAAKACSIPRGGHGAHHHHDHDGIADAAAAVANAHTPFDLPLHTWKLIFQAILTTINVFCWLVPLRSKKISENKLALSLANAFSGGVFLALAFGHLIPECIHGFDPKIFSESTPYMLVLAGYLLIFFVEKVAFDAHDILHEMEDGGGSHEHHGHHHSHDQQNGEPVKQAIMVNGGHSPKAVSSEAEKAKVASTGRSAVILLAALGVHSVLEMMALGLADTFGDCALLTLSISLHQPAESIALLVAFLKSGMPEDQVFKYLATFSCMGPIGVILGILVNEYAAPVIDSIMLAIVAGTFVYVGATEVIPEEWEDSRDKWKKFFALMSGIVSILVITQYTMTLH